MEEGSKKPADARKSTPWSLQKKILIAVLGIAIIALAAVLVAKFVFNVDLVSSVMDFATMRIKKI
jgi:polyferredoxin